MFECSSAWCRASVAWCAWAGLAGLLVVSPSQAPGQPSPERPASPAPAKRLLVIAPAAFHPALAEFIAHKQKLLSTGLIALETVLAENRGVDDAEKLKRFLYREWQDHGLGYALLVGDVDVLPVRFMVLDRVTPAAFDYAFYPSDLYYADLARADGSFDDWNAQKDGFHGGYFGEVRGEKNKRDPINYDEVSYLPEIAVGRWPVSTAEETARVATKTIRYESQVLSNTVPNLPRVAFIATGGWVDSRSLLNRLAAKLTNGWQIERRYYTEAGRAPGSLPPDHAQVRGLLNLGASLVVHAGHGQSEGWDGCLSVRDLDVITNHTALPVFISAGCSTAYFAPLPPYDGYVDVAGKEHTGTDHGEVFTQPPPPPAVYQTGRFNPTGLGEQILKRNLGGGVAYIGCNTGSQPCALTLVEGFAEAVSKGSPPRLGDCWVAAIRHYHAKERLADLEADAGWYPPSIFFQGMKFMVFGDPSLRLPTPSGKGA